MDVRDYATVLRARWLSILLSVIVFGALAFGFTELSNKVYTASASSFVTVTEAPSAADAAAIYQQSQFTISRVKSYTQMVSSPLVLDPVIKQLSLPLTAKQLAKKVSATSPSDTVILKVDATDASPSQAAAIANAVSKELATLVQSLETPSGTKASAVRVTITQPAVAPTTPSSPRPNFDIAVGIILGLAVGVIVAIFRDQLNNSVESADELQAITGTNPLGQVLHNPNAKNALVAAETNSPLSEAFSSIRVNLRFVDVDRPPRIVVLTSPTPGDGKTVIAANLAIAFAHSGARVCLVDADFRQPRFDDVLGIDNAAGLTDVLAGQHDLHDVLVSWRNGLLTVLTSGSIPPDPSALLSSNSMATVIKTLGQEFDVVIVDSPPVLPVTDAAVIGSLTDGVILVARRGRTQRQNVRRAIDSLSQANVHLLGTVINDVRVRRGRANAVFVYPSRHVTLPSDAAVAAKPVTEAAPHSDQPSVEVSDQPADADIATENSDDDGRLEEVTVPAGAALEPARDHTANITTKVPAKPTGGRVAGWRRSK